MLIQALECILHRCEKKDFGLLTLKGLDKLIDYRRCVIGFEGWTKIEQSFVPELCEHFWEENFIGYLYDSVVTQPIVNFEN